MPKDVSVGGKIYRVPSDATPDEVQAYIEAQSAEAPLASALAGVQIRAPQGITPPGQTFALGPTQMGATTPGEAVIRRVKGVLAAPLEYAPDIGGALGATLGAVVTRTPAATAALAGLGQAGGEAVRQLGHTFLFGAPQATPLEAAGRIQNQFLLGAGTQYLGGAPSRLLGGPLERSAIRNMEQALGPTGKGLRMRAEEIAPKLLETRIPLQRSPQSFMKFANWQREFWGRRIGDYGAAVEARELAGATPAISGRDVLFELGRLRKSKFVPTPRTPSFQGLQTNIGGRAAAKEGIIVEPATLRAFETHIKELGDAVRAYQGRPPLAFWLKYRQQLDNLLDYQGAFDKLPQDQQASLKAATEVADVLREHIATGYPDLKPYLAESHLWQSAHEILQNRYYSEIGVEPSRLGRYLSARLAMQGVGIGALGGAALGGGEGAIAGGLAGGIITRGAVALVDFMDAPAWKTVTAKTKWNLSRLAARNDWPSILGIIARETARMESNLESRKPPNTEAKQRNTAAPSAFPPQATALPRAQVQQWLEQQRQNPR